jgi:proteasome alpha subunit
VKALGTAGEGAPRELLPTQLEVAVLDRTLAGRTFRRVQGAVLAALLAGPVQGATAEAPAAEGDAAISVGPPVDADGSSPESSA